MTQSWEVSEKPRRKCSELLEQWGYVISQKPSKLEAEEEFVLGAEIINDLEPGVRIKLQGLSFGEPNGGITYVVTEVNGQIVWAVDWGRKFVEECMQENTKTEDLYDNRNDY